MRKRACPILNTGIGLFRFASLTTSLFVLMSLLMICSNAQAVVTPRIVGGESHTIALKSDGTLWAWGGNWVGQLGDGTEVSIK